MWLTINGQFLLTETLRQVEELSQNEGEDFAALDLDGKETYWQRAKRTIG